MLKHPQILKRCFDVKGVVKVTTVDSGIFLDCVATTAPLYVSLFHKMLRQGDKIKYYDDDNIQPNISISILLG